MRCYEFYVSPLQKVQSSDLTGPKTRPRYCKVIHDADQTSHQRDSKNRRQQESALALQCKFLVSVITLTVTFCFLLLLLLQKKKKKKKILQIAAAFTVQFDQFQYQIYSALGLLVLHTNLDWGKIHKKAGSVKKEIAVCMS